MTAQELIDLLHLQPHPKEGGFFRETYRAAELVKAASLPGRYAADRCLGTAIYYLLTPHTFSALHRLASDEIFHFYLGDPVTMLQLAEGGQGRTLTLGTNLPAGQHLQVMVPRGVWQGSFLQPGGSFALLGCTVAPGFDYADYESATRSRLSAQYPAFADLIKCLTVD